jgi:SP family sugar:H+ symporter-like MFS transporter
MLSRSLCVPLATNWLWNFLLSFFSNKVASKYGTFIMLIFGSILFTAAIIVFLIVPELKGLTLEQVDEMFEDRSIKPWNSGKWMPTTGAQNRDTLSGLPWQKKKNHSEL